MRLFICSFFFLVFLSNCWNQQSPIIQQQNVKIVFLKNYYRVGGCGTVAFAAGYIFNYENYTSNIVGIIRCPDLYGEGFFVEGGKYKAGLSDVSITDSLKEYTTSNPFEKMGYKTFLITYIEKY